MWPRWEALCSPLRLSDKRHAHVRQMRASFACQQNRKTRPNLIIEVDEFRSFLYFQKKCLEIKEAAKLIGLEEPIYLTALIIVLRFWCNRTCSW